MSTTLHKAQLTITKFFIWTSPFVMFMILATNYPEFEKKIWLIEAIVPFLAIIFGLWVISFMFVFVTTFISSRYKEDILHDVVLKEDRDEREAFVSAKAAKKSILITVIASLFILICTTDRYNKAENFEKSSVTIGHFQFTDNQSYVTQEEGGFVTHFQIPMSKTGLVLLIMLIQLFSFHIFNLTGRKKMD